MIDGALVRLVLRHIRIGPGCWEWTGASSTYGKMKWRGRVRRLHCLMFEAIHGTIPMGLLVRHRCDNKKCARPTHLLPGTRQDNADDAVERGLVSRGAHHSEVLRASWLRSRPERRQAAADAIRDVNRRLTDDQVIRIRARLASGSPQQVIADEFSVSNQTISAINRGHIWRSRGLSQ